MRTRLDSHALAAELSAWATHARQAVVRIGEAGHRAELDRLRAAVTSLLGLRVGSGNLRVRRAQPERVAAIELDLVANGESFRLELSKAGAIGSSCFRGFRLAARHDGTVPAGIELNRMGNHLARVDRAGDPAPDVALALEWLEGGGWRNAESEIVPDGTLFGSEAPAVRRMLREQRRWTGSAPRVMRRESAGVEMLSLELERDRLPSASIFDLPPRIVADPLSATYLRRLGFDWTSDGTIRAVPFPESYRRALVRHELADAGFLPQILERSSMRHFDRNWLLGQTAGRLSIQLGSIWYYAMRRPLALARHDAAKRRWEAHFAMLPRQLARHLLPSQLMPRRLLRTIGRTLPPQHFYANDLYLHCRSLWGSVESLEELPAALVAAESLKELLDRLARA